MKITHNEEIASFKGEPIKLDADGKPLTIAALLELIGHHDSGLTAGNAVELFQLAKTLHDGGEAHITSEQITAIKDATYKLLAKQPFIAAAVAYHLDHIGE